MMNPSLLITDGTIENTVNLLALKGWTLKDWKPSIPDPKGGGVFRNSPLVDGRKLAYRKLDNVTDSFNLIGNADSQDEMIATIQKLQRLLEKATSYWTTSWQSEPVWMEARASNETGTRYAVIVDYRLTGFGGPFQQPFFSTGCNSATEAILVIEHMLWQGTEPGAAGSCVECGNAYYSADVATWNDDDFTLTQSSDDATFNRIEANLDDVECGVGYTNLLTDTTQLCVAGLLFNNVSLPAKAKIAKATLALNPTAPFISDNINFRISCQDPTYGDAATFSTTTDFFARHWLPSPTIVNVADDTFPDSIDVTRMIQMLVGNPINDPLASSPLPEYIPTGWASGDDIALKIELESSGGGMKFSSFDSGSDFAVLSIQYSPTSTALGREATCTHEVMVSNKQSNGVITDVYFYDDSGGTWSDNLVTKAKPCDILPATPAVGDKLYIISNTALINGGKFNNVVFDIGTAQTGITNGVWSYWNGAFHPFIVTDDANKELDGDAFLFAVEGVTSIVFETMLDWATTAIHGVTGYCICLEITAAGGGATAPTQEDRPIYTAVNPYVDIAADQVKGDIPALARILWDEASNPYRSMNTLVVGLRSLSRGSGFSAYLNASDIGNVPGVSFTVNTTTTGLDSGDIIASARAPTGKALDLTSYIPNASGKTDLWQICYWTVMGSLAKEYLGIYHAYVRIYASAGGSVGAVKFRLKSVFGEEYNASYSDIGTVTAYPYDIAIDLGQFNILPSSTIRSGDIVNMIRIYLEAYSDTDADFVNSLVYDVVLIPADEWSGNFGMPKITGSSVLYYGTGLDIDGITNPRQYRAVQTSILIPSDTYIEANRSVSADWARIASGEPVFQQNSAQRLWFLQYKHQNALLTYFENCGKVCLQGSPRYLLARGTG